MIQQGDKLICIQSHPGNEIVPAIKKDATYFVNGVITCSTCAHQFIDIGFSFNHYPAPYITTSPCVCNRHLNTGNVPVYSYTYFRKIEPDYRVIEVSESILEQAKKLLTPETIAQ